MARLEWDKTGEHFYETGVKNGVLYPYDKNNATKPYSPGVAWNGLTSISESPSGADENAIYADNIKYLSLRGAEEFGATIEAYTYPDEWAACDGSAMPVTGLVLGQQSRKMFGFCYRTELGNDIDGDSYGYKLLRDLMRLSMTLLRLSHSLGRSQRSSRLLERSVALSTSPFRFLRSMLQSSSPLARKMLSL